MCWFSFVRLYSFFLSLYSFFLSLTHFPSFPCSLSLLFFLSQSHTHTHTRARTHTHMHAHTHTHTYTHTRAHTSIHKQANKYWLIKVECMWYFLGTKKRVGWGWGLELGLQAVDQKSLSVCNKMQNLLLHTSFSYQTSVLWNSSPISLRHSSSTSAFKSALKTHLFPSQ